MSKHPHVHPIIWPIIQKNLRLPVGAGKKILDPHTLFASGEKGVWLDPSELATMFQDSAGTVPATLGSPVGLILDKSGNSHSFAQATATSRPILMQDGNGRNYLYFDGVDDYLVCQNSNWSATMVASAGLLQTATTNAWAGLAAGSGDYFWIGDPTAGDGGVSNSGSGSGVTNYGNGVPLQDTRSSIGAAVSGSPSVLSSAALDLSSSFWKAPTVFGAYAMSAFFYQGRMYGLLLSDHVEQRPAIERYMGSKIGVKL